MIVAALYVEKGGVYFGLPGVDPWDEERDARKYAGPHPVVAHPPCERWGRSADGGSGFRGAVRPVAGDDNGCFAAALAALIDYGGVLEHPEGSKAWAANGLGVPARNSGWVSAGRNGLYTCCVEQGHYGHRARKATWLLANAPNLPALKWGESSPAPSVNSMPRALPPGRRASRTGILQRMSRKQRKATPPAFRDALLAIARSATLRSAP